LDSGYLVIRMSLMHYARPFFELGVCKEYCMARKTTGNTTTTRSKKAGASIPRATMQVASEVPKNGKPVNRPVDLEEEIRRRAYELYLERRATAGNAMGDENQDWLVAEREILSLHGGQEQHSA
jgi:hypothetical protein